MCVYLDYIILLAKNRKITRLKFFYLWCASKRLDVCVSDVIWKPMFLRSCRHNSNVLNHLNSAKCVIQRAEDRWRIDRLFLNTRNLFKENGSDAALSKLMVQKFVISPVIYCLKSCFSRTCIIFLVRDLKFYWVWNLKNWIKRFMKFKWEDPPKNPTGTLPNALLTSKSTLHCILKK